MSHPEPYVAWRDLHAGMSGPDVRRLQELLAGGNRHGYHAHPGTIDGQFGKQTGDAVQRMKWYLGYKTAGITRDASEKLRGYMVHRGYPAYRALSPAMRLRKRRRRGTSYPGLIAGPGYPLAAHGPIIGRPYEGTHLDFHNWESDNAIDIAVPIGTHVLAIEDGTIGSQIGPLPGSLPQLVGQRLHLAHGTQEWYYAHLSRIIVRAGQQVRAGQVLGYSGAANGVSHLHLGQHHGDPGVTVGSPSPGYRDRNYPG